MTREDYAKVIFSMSLELSDLDVPNTVEECWTGYKISFPWCKGDVAMHDWTYRSEDGFVETFQFPWDMGDVSVLHPKTAIKFIQRHWLESLESEV